MKRLFRNKVLTWLLLVYGILQLSSMFLQAPVILFAYELCYLIALVVGTIWVIRKTKENRDLKTLGETILLFLLINLGLFLVYIPTLLLNSSINWTLNGENESDPMILLAFWPPVHFTIAFVTLGLAGLITRLMIPKEIKKAVHNKT